ncbi:hypothetical protein [Streptantibioticus ferralitis]|uniref:Uncharacterized protein n=1 Tax=Streptantibioticus ferralitis TaxID=236510 RepID=A0ABT5YXH1_9ACTN|nr:hypothetical protein [Streptantibioticus ferralitis]MDF2256297.1 hypothetical protein [Streptantibioticus ferralitis]
MSSGITSEIGIRPADARAEGAPGSLAALEAAVARLTAAALELREDTSPWAVSRREEAADRAVDLLAARAWRALPTASHGQADVAARRCVSYTLAEDAASAAEGGGTDPATPHRLAAHALLLLTLAEHFDAATLRARDLLGPIPEGRLLAAWRMVDQALLTLSTTRHEWVGAEPGVVAAAGWVLVDRVGRLLTGAALVAQAAERTRDAEAVPPESADGTRAATAELLVNAARRYAWNHLRGPAPEAATPTHIRRSTELVRALAPAAGDKGSP